MTSILAVTMPKFGLAMTEGKVVSWAKEEGAAVAVGDEIADIETTKITNTYESAVAGVLRRHVAREQEDLPVGALIAVIADRSVTDSDIDAFVAQFQAEFATLRRKRAPRPHRNRAPWTRRAARCGISRRVRNMKAGRLSCCTALAAI